MKRGLGREAALSEKRREDRSEGLIKEICRRGNIQRTIGSHVYLLSRFESIYAEKDLDSAGHDEIYTL